MPTVGIESLNVFGGSLFLDVETLAGHRQLDPARFRNLLMEQKAVALPYEDPVTFAVNAAKPLVDELTQDQKDRIELLVTCSESGIDFSKSLSTYLHHYLGLSRNCRMLEVKQACYAGTAGLQMAINFVLSQTSPGAKALVVATDISRFMVAEGGDALTEDWSFAEPSAGAGAVAMLIGDQAEIFQLDVGAHGYYGYEVMDTCRPVPDSEAGDADLSLLSYLDCCEAAFNEYAARVEGAEFGSSFDYLAFHTPFAGMVKGAHRTMMRKTSKGQTRAPDIEADFVRRVTPGLKHCQRVGNIMGGTVFLALASTIDHGDFDSPRRVGMFSYGSGCCSEFYSGVVTPAGQQELRKRAIGSQLQARYQLNIDEYESLLRGSSAIRFGTRNVVLDQGFLASARASMPRGRLILREIRDFHRLYEWT